jgi:hypothetical protein
MDEERPDERTWTERIQLTGQEVLDRAKQLIEEGNVRRLVIKGQNNEFRLEVPLTAGAAVGSVLTVMNPVLVAVGALAALVTKVDLEIVRVGEPGSKSDTRDDQGGSMTASG